MEHLERGVLGMITAQQAGTASFRSLLERISPSALGCMGRYPWSSSADLPLPHCINKADVTLSGNLLADAMNKAGIGPPDIRAEIVFEGEFNRHVEATNNKATALFDVTSRLLDWLWQRSEAGEMRVYVDRQGGRTRYLPALQRIFPACQFKILSETERSSAYRITGASRQAEIHFLVNGEDSQLPVALASMVSKYLRELFMEQLNAFWAEQVPGLAPTAGYYTDGRRFYQEISGAVQRLGVDRRLLYRCR